MQAKVFQLWILFAYFILNFYCQDEFTYDGPGEEVEMLPPIVPMDPRSCKTEDGVLVKPGAVVKMRNKPCQKCICNPITRSIKCKINVCNNCGTDKIQIGKDGECCPICKKKKRPERPRPPRVTRRYTKEITTIQTTTLKPLLKQVTGKPGLPGPQGPPGPPGPPGPSGCSFNIKNYFA